MTPTITSVNLNNTPETETPIETHHEEPVATPPTDTPGTGAADDIDTDELEALLVDLKEAKKNTKAMPKKRIRKIKKDKATMPEPEHVEEDPVVVEEQEQEPLLEPEQKPKRKYIRKPRVAPALPLEEPVAEPAVVDSVKRSPLGLIEEMQRAERALRYQMRKNKMQTLVSQAF